MACINSAWRSTGIGSQEKGKMIVGEKVIRDAFETIEEKDVKICVMHHPLDWLVDDDKRALEKCISGFDIVLNGHIHENDTKACISYNGQTIFNTCGKFDTSSDIYNGYTLISINQYNSNCAFILRQYYGAPRNCFDKAITLQENGVFSASIKEKSTALSLAYSISCAISDKFLDYANGYFVSNVASGKILKSFDESFIQPILSKKSEKQHFCTMCSNIILVILALCIKFR